jgi:hypothetical protein
MVLYSVTRDSALFVANADSTELFGAVELADVDRDSVADVIVARAHSISDSFGLSRIYTMWTVERFSGASQFQTMAVDSIDAYALDEPMAMLKAIDLNSDGFQELVTSVDNTSFVQIAPFIEYYTSAGSTRAYFSFPDSVVWESPYCYTSLSDVPVSGGINIRAANAKSYYYYFGHGADVQTDRSELCLLRSDGTASAIAGVPYSTTTPCMSEDHSTYFATPPLPIS